MVRSGQNIRKKVCKKKKKELTSIIIHQVISLFRTSKGENVEYFVKWKELPYTEATWESEEDLCDFTAEIRKFEEAINSSRRSTGSKAHSENSRKFKANLFLALHRYVNIY